MADRVAVYIDFDNVVISRYDHVHGKGSWRKGDARAHGIQSDGNDPISAKLAAAKVDLGAIIDYATSFGIVAMTRAYADWSVPANAAYRHDLVDRAVDLVQLFPASGTKNGADIRLAVDAVEDLARHSDITHVVVVAGDSDYVPLAQRCRKLGRKVVGIGVAGSTSRAFVSACDEFARYEELPGVRSRPAPNSPPPPPTITMTPSPQTPVEAPSAKKAPVKKAAVRRSAPSEAPELKKATELLVRAVELGLQKSDDEWIHAAGVKSPKHVESRMVQNRQLLRLR